MCKSAVMNPLQHVVLACLIAVASLPITARGEAPATPAESLANLDGAGILGQLRNGGPDSPGAEALAATALLLVDDSELDSSVAALDTMLATKSEAYRELRDQALALRKSDLEVNPGAVTFDTLLLTNEMQQSMLRAAVSGWSDEVAETKSQVAASELPAPIKQHLTRYADLCANLADAFAQTELAAATGREVAMGLAHDREVDEAFNMLGDYRKDPDSVERGRAGEANEFTVMAAQESAKADMVNAITAQYKAYLDGEKTKLEMMKTLQELESGALDLKEKRATIYWTLRKLREENLAEKRAQQIARNKEITTQDKEETAADLSPTWPSAFEHRELKPHADQLRENLMSYGPSNSGQLSACYAKCVSNMRSLHRVLGSGIDGVSVEQCAALRRYLRKLDAELQQNYRSDNYIASLVSSPSSQNIADSDLQEEFFIDVKPAKLRFTGDNRQIASFAIYRSLLSAIVRAGAAGNTGELSTLAKQVRESSLLLPEHRESLKKIGSSVYKNAGKASSVEDLGDVLAVISGASDSASSLDLPADYQAEAYEILIASTLGD
ncbi:hypothetical protein [Stieleria varia]|uniref:Uncharacterized protein n=1 Tax=Stieleria varia TaxID=2528005 RepID=A0A5C6A390_9BACT|nr:hypothetical protein [Stieleria varia]TWT93840.1 hypothetical protein Pla52n_56680 [Stieleria varia]